MGRMISGFSLGFLAAFAALSAAAHAEEAKPAAMPPRPPLEAYGKLPAIEDVAISPDGENISLIGVQNGKRSIIVASTGTGKSFGFEIGATEIDNLFWGSNRRVVIKTTKKNRFPDYKFDIADHLFDIKDKALSIFGHCNPIGGRRLIDGKYMTNCAGGDLNLYEIDTDIHRTFHPSHDDDVYDTLLDEKGKLIAKAAYYWNSHTWALFGYPGGEIHKIYSVGIETDFPELEGLGRDGSSVVVWAPSAGEHSAFHYYEVSPEGQFSAPLEPNGVEFEPIFHPKTHRLAGFLKTEDDYETLFFDPALEKLNAAAKRATPGQRSYIVGMAEDPRKLILYTEGDQNPGSYYFMDFAAGKFVGIGEAYPDIPSEWVARKQRITYTAADGEQIPAFLTLPPGRDPKKLPLIVLPHGGPELHDTIGFDSEAQALASRGYAVLQPNFRGSSGYGLGFVEKGFGEWGRKMQTDLSDGVRALAKQGLIDPARVCIVGASYGGYAALAGAAIDRGVYRCAVSVSGLSDLKAFERWSTTYHGYDSPTTRYWRRFFGPQSGWDEISPYRQADKVSIPVLLIHGDKDKTVPDEQSTLMYEALKARGKTVDFVSIKDGDHQMHRSEWRLQELNAVVAFVEKYNPAD